MDKEHLIAWEAKLIRSHCETQPWYICQAVFKAMNSESDTPYHAQNSQKKKKNKNISHICSSLEQ